MRPQRLAQPLHWKRPRMIFVNSMSDLFHKEVQRGFIDRVFETMERADWHKFQVLTKRSSLMARYLKARYGAAQRRPTSGAVFGRGCQAKIPHCPFCGAPASMRFLSLEPLLGPLGRLDLAGIDWVIVGGERGRAHDPWTPTGCAKSVTNA